MNRQELIEKIENEKFIKNNSDFEIGYNLASNTILRYIEHLDEPEKVIIPQFVADYIERTKNEDYHLLGAMAEIRSHKNKEIDDWFYTDDNIEVFARAWLDGYTIEEKRYRVKMKAIKSNSQYLVFGKLSETWWFGSAEQIGNVKSEHTHKEIEDAGFGEVFNSPLFEVEEVAE